MIKRQSVFGAMAAVGLFSSAALGLNAGGEDANADANVNVWADVQLDDVDLDDEELAIGVDAVVNADAELDDEDEALDAEIDAEVDAEVDADEDEGDASLNAFVGAFFGDD